MRRTISVAPGVFNSVSYTYRRPGSSPYIRLVCDVRSARPPKANRLSGTGSGDRGWLISTPFLTVDVTSDGGEEYKVLLAIDSSAPVEEIEARLLSKVPDHAIVPVGEKDAAFVAMNMNMPMLVITENGRDGGMVAVFRKHERQGL